MTTESSLLTLFVQNCRSHHTATNSKYRLRAFARWLESEFGIVDLEAVQVKHVLAYKMHLAKTGLAATSQARALETIRSFFRWCQETGLIAVDPACKVKSPRAVLNREPVFLEVEESKKLFEAAGSGPHKTRDTAMLWCLSSGLRVSEVTGLDMADLIEPKSGAMAGLRVHGKRSYERIVPIGEAAYQALTAYAETRKGAAGTSPLFAGHYGGERDRRLTARAVEKWFVNLAVIRAGLDRSKAHPHCCRHGAAMRWLYESTTPGGVYTVARLLGHTSISTTERYLHVKRGAMEAAVSSDPLVMSRAI